MDGCEKCSTFLHKIFPEGQKLKISKSVSVELKEAIEELFAALGLNNVLMEGDQIVSVTSFIKDFIKTVDEVKNVEDIVEIWHIDPFIAQNLFMLFKEVVFGKLETSEAFEDMSNDWSEVESDEFDEETE